MELLELRSTMDRTDYVSVNRAIQNIQSFIMQKENLGVILNPIIKKMEANSKQLQSSDILKWFIQELRPIVDNTQICKSVNDVVAIARAVFTNGNFYDILVMRARNGFKPFPTFEKEQELAEKEKAQQIIAESELTPGQLKAKRMREAKAKKQAEREAIELEAKKVNKNTEVTQKPKSSKLTDSEYAAYLATRGL